MLESDWLTNVLRCAIIFRETHGECSSRQVLTALHVHITSPNDLRYFKGPYSLKQQKNQNPQHTGQTNKYSKQKDKNERLYPCFCHKITLYVWKAHTPSLLLSLPHRQFVHVNISANVVSATLTILSVT